jgi:hypothetical protein
MNVLHRDLLVSACSLALKRERSAQRGDRTVAVARSDLAEARP